MPIYERYGKVEYYKAKLPDTEWAWSYSANELQLKFMSILVGQEIEGIYVGLDGYLESMHNDKNVIDLTYMGGTVLLLFKKIVVEILIHVEGMIEYRCFSRWEIRLQKINDYPPDDMALSEKYYYNVSLHEIDYVFLGKRVDHVAVKGTNTWGFSATGFDEERADVAAKENNLPTEIVLYLANAVKVSFVGDGIEYFWILFESSK